MRIHPSVHIICLLMLLPHAIWAGGYGLESPRNEGTFRFELNNDAIWDRDSNFSNGWSLQYHTIRYPNWEATSAPEWIKWIGMHFPTLSNEDTVVRYGQGVGQNMVTPEDLSNPNPPEGDLPYAGTLTYTQNWQSFNRQTAQAFQVNVGILGQEAFAENVQTFFHKELLHSEEPQGWDTQRETEPILNLAYEKLWRIASWGTYTNGWAGQMTTSPIAHLGNLLTAVELGFALRLGWNIQEGFGTVPAPPGRGFFHSYQLPKPASASPHSVELVLGVRGTGLIYSVVYDGSIITDDDRSVNREDIVWSGGLGINYHYYDCLSIRFSLLVNSGLLVTASLPASTSGGEKTSSDVSYGTLAFEFHF